jgi:hypothetical protein
MIFLFPNTATNSRRPPEGRDVALKRRHLVLIKTLAALKPGDCLLVNVGRFPDLDLSPPNSFAQSSERKINPALRPQPSPQDPHQIQVELGCLAHARGRVIGGDGFGDTTGSPYLWPSLLAGSRNGNADHLDVRQPLHFSRRVEYEVRRPQRPPARFDSIAVPPEHIGPKRDVEVVLVPTWISAVLGVILRRAREPSKTKGALIARPVNRLVRTPASLTHLISLLGCCRNECTSSRSFLL